MGKLNFSLQALLKVLLPAKRYFIKFLFALIIAKNSNIPVLQIDGVKTVIFADHYADVSKKLKAFQHICSELFKHQIKFTLAFSTILQLSTKQNKSALSDG